MMSVSFSTVAPPIGIQSKTFSNQHTTLHHPPGQITAMRCVSTYSNMLVILICEKRYRYAPTVDLVLLSHGDLAHSGLYAYAYARWGLKAPAYTTIPVQAMARIVTLEDIEGIRDEQNIDDLVPEQDLPNAENSPSDTEDRNQSRTEESSISFLGKYVATVQEVHEAYDAVNTLRYSQPTHLQG